MIAYGCCVGSWSRFNTYVNRHGRVNCNPTLALAGQTSIAVAYNVILDALNAEYGDQLDAVVLQHDDLEITDLNFEAKVCAATQLSDVGLIGVAGAVGEGSLAWWNWPETKGYQRIADRELNFSDREGYVDALEGSILIFTPWALRNLRFDTRFPGFHGYDEICRQVREAGKYCYVADIETFHHVSLGFKSTVSEVAWWEAERLFKEKWSYA